MTENLVTIASDLAREVDALSFGPPVSRVYNPLRYAWPPHEIYLTRYGAGRKEIIFLGMNPGPWGMAQTGIPFGDVEMVRDWLDIEAEVAEPAQSHPKRRVEGFRCRRREVSGSRFWGWARERYSRPDKFFRRFFVANYCPLCFLEESGRNRTPDRLPCSEREPLLSSCDRALRRTVRHLQPRMVIGVGKFTADRATQALQGMGVATGCITHPSPANPRANRGWAALVEEELADLGIDLEA